MMMRASEKLRVQNPILAAIVDGIEMGIMGSIYVIGMAIGVGTLVGMFYGLFTLVR